MKVVAFIFLILTQSAVACNVNELRKEIFGHFVKGVPLENQLGEKQATTTLKELYLTDAMMRLRGEDFLISRLVFNILWNNGVKEEREMLLAAVIDMASCKVESYESGDVFGSTISIKP